MPQDISSDWDYDYLKALTRQIDSCSEIRVNIGGVHKYKFLDDEDITILVEALNLLAFINAMLEEVDKE